MNRRETIRIAWRGVSANRVRSFLTILGILIGVASVVILVAVGNGSTIAVQKQFQSLGTNSLTIQPGGRGFGRRGGAGAGAQPLSFTMKDVAALQSKDYKANVKIVVPVIRAGNVTGAVGDTSASVDPVNGSTPEIQEVQNWKVAAGRFFNADDLKSRSRVVVLGDTTAQNLFGDANPVGQSVALNHITFTVIGKLKAKGASGPFNQDDAAFAPWTTVRDTLAGGTTVDQILIEATSQKATTEAQNIATTELSGRHPTTNGQQNFRVLNQSALVQSSAQSSKTLTVLLGAVAAISLLVGGIGIMNIMLVTVTERTREIGIRKAVGAPRSAILGQFLTEAVVLGGIGGIIGVISGIVGSRFKIVGTQPVVRYDSVILALAVAVITSLFFGIYPANRAASMRPIDALRHE